MKLYDTLTELLRDVRDRDRWIRFIDGEKDETTVSFSGALGPRIIVAWCVAGARYAAWR